MTKKLRATPRRPEVFGLPKARYGAKEDLNDITLAGSTPGKWGRCVLENHAMFGYRLQFKLEMSEC